MWAAVRALLRRRSVQNALTFDEARCLGPWLGKGFWALADQGLFAVSNFVLNVLVARWISPEDYGSYAVAFSVFLFLGMFHSALITEPMLVYGPGRYKDCLSKYMGVLLYGHFGFGALGSLILLLTGLVARLYGLNVLSSAFFGLALAEPFILFAWLMRRACYVHLKTSLAASGSALYMAMMLLGVYILYHHQWLSPFSAFIVMGFAGLVAGLLLAICLEVGRYLLIEFELVREAFGSHWSYGRWATASNVVAWVAGNIYYLLLPVWGGFGASGALRALMNLLMPVLHANTALSVLLVPTLVRIREHPHFGQIVRNAMMLFTLASALYWILLCLFHVPLMTWLYGGKYAEYADLVWLLGLLPLTAGLVAVLGSTLRALERPDQVFLAYALSLTVGLPFGVWFMGIRGVAGAIIGLLLTSVTNTGAMAWFILAWKATVTENDDA